MPQMSQEKLDQLRAQMPKAPVPQAGGQTQQSAPSTGQSQSAPTNVSPQQAQMEYQRKMMEQQRLQMQHRTQGMQGQQQVQGMQTTQVPQNIQGVQNTQGMQNVTPESLSSIQTQTAPQPTPQPNPGMNVSQGGGTSAQQAMRARMLASRNQANNTSQNVMQQGDTYDPNTPAQQQPQDNAQNTSTANQQQNDIANNTIINTTDTTGQGSTEQGKKNKVLVGAAVGIVALIGIIFIISKFGGKSNPDDSQVVDEWNEDEYEWIVPEDDFAYSEEQIASLREMGWTADEIEAAQEQHTPASTLIKQSRAARNAYIQLTLAPMYDTASYEYKHFIEQTWLTLPQRHDMNEWKNIASYYVERKNLDYEKIDVYGKQLFIKVYLDDNLHEDWFFITVTPEEWDRLDDFGNIVINYTYVTRYDGEDIWTAEEDFDNYYITDANIEFTN